MRAEALRPHFENPALGRRVQAMARELREAGGRAFLVGGVVRDACLGRTSREADLEVYGLEPGRLETLLRGHGTVLEVGRQFAILHLVVPEGRIEVSLPRRESKTGPGHKGFAVQADPRLDPRTASLRRDFTVNAMLLDPLDGELLDFHGGREDLARGLLRHVSEAFAEDPLRVLRAARFAARFGWRVAPETVALCRRLDLSELPAERLEGEWKEILLRGARPGRGLEVLEDTGALRWFPEVAALRGVPQDPVWHPEGDVFHHTCRCLDAAARYLREGMEDPWSEMLAVLCHDFGKPAATRLEGGRWRAPEHDRLGEEPTRSFLARFSRERDLPEKVVPLVREHLRPSQLWLDRERVGDAAIRRLSTRVSLPALVRVARADGAGRLAPFEDPWPPGEWLLQRAASLGVRDRRPEPLVRGRDLLALGLRPGPVVGRVLGRLYEEQLEGLLPDREAALERARILVEELQAGDPGPV